MASIDKPRITHPGLQRNELGLLARDYEGTMSTLCAGCGHDSVTASLITALWRSNIAPHQIAKLSGIGCSAKTASYFAKGAHGFNGVHGRMPALATGAAAANRELICVGISGDGDSLSIGLGQLCHLMRRNVRLLYLIDNNGVYGLTKGQFSASADPGSKSKKGEVNQLGAIDPMLLGLALGATFLARSFSGDKQQLVPILEAGLAHPGLAVIDVISPCVTFNDHEGSTKSYLFTREHEVEATVVDFVPPQAAIVGTIPAVGSVSIPMPSGVSMQFRAVPEGYDPSDRAGVMAYLVDAQNRGEVATGLLYHEIGRADMHELNQTVEMPLVELAYEDLQPGALELAKVGFR